MSDNQPRFCSQCGGALLPNAKFCIECGRVVRSAETALLDPEALEPDPADDEIANQPETEYVPATGPTVRLGNAASDQAVIGGTIKLATAAAFPPGLWFTPELPLSSDVLAVYVPLRAVVGGWSATTRDGWKIENETELENDSSRRQVAFSTTREWFAAKGAAHDFRLHVRIGARSYAREGRDRIGFRYQIGHDPPMQVLAAWWNDANGQPRRDLSVPLIQLMAPPRAKRVSDYSEPIETLPLSQAEAWQDNSEVQGIYCLDNTRQQRTLVGRGIPLFAPQETTFFGAVASALSNLSQLFTRQTEPLSPFLRTFQRIREANFTQHLYCVQLRHPLRIARREWLPLLRKINEEAASLGLDLDTDAVIEWWFDRHGYDGAVFEPHSSGKYGARQTVIAFRRSQIAQIED